MRIKSSDSFQMMDRAGINPQIIIECRQKAMGINVLWLLLEHVVQHLLDCLELPQIVIGLGRSKRRTRS